MDLVGPARVPHPPVDRRGDLELGIIGAERCQLVGELIATPLHQLGHPVQDLSAVVSRCLRPPFPGVTRRPNRVAHVLPGPSGRPGQDLPLRAHGRIGTPRLRPGERPADVQLVGLADVEPPRGHRRPPFVSTSSR
jgi:hypothetical protein